MQQNLIYVFESIVLQVETAGNYTNMEGYLEKLPISKAKDTFLKTWKRRYFKAHNGTLHYYEVLGLVIEKLLCYFYSKEFFEESYNEVLDWKDVTNEI